MRRFPLIRRNSDPFLAEFDLGRFFEDFFKGPLRFGFAAEKEPAIDIYEKDGRVVAEVEVPGARPEDIRLSVDGDLLTVSGEKKVERRTKKEDYYRVESSYGRFQRSVQLPYEVKAEGAKAAYKNGVLKVELPKAETQRKSDIKIDIE